MILVAMLAAAAASATALAPAAAPSQLEFKGATLGMTLTDWKASPYPGVGRIGPVCSGEAGAAAAGIVISAAERSEGALVCTYAYADPGGLRAEVPIGNGLFARRVRYVFRDGRLVAISYRASPDAFDAVVARVDAQLGHPSQMRRDQIRFSDGAVWPRVRMRWSSPAGVVVLTDPEASGRLSVVFVTPAFASTQALASG